MPAALAEIGEALVMVEDRAQRVRRHRTAQQCLDLAAALVALARELDPDLPPPEPRERTQ